MNLTVTLEDLIDDIRIRQSFLRADRNIHTFFLKEEDPRKLIVYSFGHVLKGIERKATLVDLSVTIGRRLRQRLRLPRNSVSACHVGWFILVSFIEKGLLYYEMKHFDKRSGKKSKYLTYHARVNDRKSLFEIWSSIADDEKVDLFPSLDKPAPWVGGMHPLGYGIIKKASPDILKKFSPEAQPMVFRVLNKLGSAGWLVNKPVLDVFNFFLDQKEGPTPFKFRDEKDEERRESLIIEASSIQRLANKHVDKVFYHLYNFDFRGRVYVNTAL
jgi:hypothetical protein